MILFLPPSPPPSSVADLFLMKFEKVAIFDFKTSNSIGILPSFAIEYHLVDPSSNPSLPANTLPYLLY